MARLVLLIDDDIEGRDIVELAFAKRGYEVLSVSNGAQALSLLESMTVDLIVVDGLLPDINGLSILSSLRQRGDETKVIMLTGHSFFWEDEKTSRMIRHDLKARLLSKPITTSMLFAHVDEVFAE